MSGQLTLTPTLLYGRLCSGPSNLINLIILGSLNDFGGNVKGLCSVGSTGCVIPEDWGPTGCAAGLGQKGGPPGLGEAAMASARKQMASSSKVSCSGLMLQYHFLATAIDHKSERILLKVF